VALVCTIRLTKAEDALGGKRLEGEPSPLMALLRQRRSPKNPKDCPKKLYTAEELTSRCEGADVCSPECLEAGYCARVTDRCSNPPGNWCCCTDVWHHCCEGSYDG